MNEVNQKMTRTFLVRQPKNLLKHYLNHAKIEFFDCLEVPMGIYHEKISHKTTYFS